MEKQKYYITTAIAYTSGKPHIGNTYEVVLADAIARYKRQQGYDVFFQTGTDEHGQKIELKAEEAGITPKEFVDNVSGEIKRIWDLMNTSYDKFIRTTDEDHEKQVKKIFKKMYAKGDIYKGHYEGMYCTPCESFFTESQLVDGKCPDCGRPCVPAKEEAYFFKMSKYADKLIDYINTHPDFIQPEAHKIFTDYHRTLIEEGISGFKLDECDNSNISFASATWCFPDMAQFPSGIDGEKMHQVFGSLYVNAMDSIYREKNTRTYQDYRSSGMFMSSRNAVLYSDTYDPKEYIQALCNSAFGGLLWCPEVREAHSAEDFFHRLQTVILSPQAMVNAWYLQYAPWLQFDRGKNERGEFLPEAKRYEEYARTLINLRMQLIPYLYSAFYTYYKEGVPPFRPLLMDYPKDERLRTISDQYMMGDGLMAAPQYQNKKTRTVYFPEGTWYNFNTNEKYEGNREYEITTELDQLPLYVRQGTLLPLAAPVPYVDAQTVFDLHCKVYGAPSATFLLLEDDGISYDFQKGQFNEVTLEAAKGCLLYTSPSPRDCS